MPPVGASAIMDRSKEADLVLAVLAYALRCLADGDLRILHEMGFGPRELEALQDIELGDLHRADNLRVHCLKIDLQREVFRAMLNRLRAHREFRELQRALLSADAPREMMGRLFGMSDRDYTRWRRALAVMIVNGRPPDPGEDEANRLWNAWKRRVAARKDRTLAARDYLGLMEETGIHLRGIWKLVQCWERFGEGDRPLSSGMKLSQHGDAGQRL